MEENVPVEFLQELSDFIGIEGVTLDADGICTLEFQDEFLFILRFNKNLRRLVLIAEIAASVKNSAEVFSSALLFNALRIAAPGPWVSLDPNTRTLFLADDFLINDMTLAEFRERLAQFFEQYLACQGLLGEEATVALIPLEKNMSSLELQQIA